MRLIPIPWPRNPHPDDQIRLIERDVAVLKTAFPVREFDEVDEEGNWNETLDTLATAHGPDPGNIWTCRVCGAEAEVTT